MGITPCPFSADFLVPFAVFPVAAVTLAEGFGCESCELVVMGPVAAKLIQDLVLYAVGCLVLVVGLRQLDPNREAAKKTKEHKKEISKRLGRPLFNTNPYEVFFFSRPTFYFPVFS